MKEKYELVGHGDSAYLIRKYKKHWWSKWKKEMDGNASKRYPVDQEHCNHDYEFIEIFISASYPRGVLWKLMRCKKCGHERATLL